MSEFATEIESLFGAPQPRSDETGVLALLLAQMSGTGVTGIALIGADGAVRGSEPIVCQELLALASELSSRVGSEAPPRISFVGRGAGLDDATAILLAEDESPAPYLVFTHRPGAFDQLESHQLSACTSLAGSALRSLRRIDEISSLNARVQHLDAELWTLRQAHAETVTWLLNEREEHLQAKRLHIVQLEAEVRKRSAALQEALDKAENANRAKSDFLANVSHEIRTPMTAILGFSENLLQEDLSEPDRAEAVHTIRRNGQHLLEIINDILDLSKIEAGKLETVIVPCSPSREIADVVQLMKVRAAEKSVALEVEQMGPIPETIYSDPMRLRQILINLVGNAIKFTPAGEVRLRVSLVAPGGDGAAKLQVDVIDSGIGITPEQMTNLFRPFGQADSSVTRRFGGTGLGLTISKRLSQMLGGDVVVKSAPGKGSTFSVTIETGSLNGVRMIDSASESIRKPSPPQAPTGAAKSVAAAIRLDGVRVLLAEDGPDNQRLLTAILRKAGADVTLAENGKRAIDEVHAAQFAATKFDVILMDMQMPEMDGYTAAGMLRREGYAAPIVALTAHAMSGDREKCLAAGCTDFLTKPIDRTALLSAVLKYAHAPSALTAAAT